MSRILLLFSALLFIGGCHTVFESESITDFNNTNPDGFDGQVIAFVGEKISLNEVPYESWCGENEICMDARYNARYRVVEILKGNYKASTIDFEVYDHAAKNPFYPHERVILYVQQYGERLVHRKYQYDLLSPVKGGEHAVCGDPYANYDLKDIEEIGREPLTAYKFEPPIVKNVSQYLPHPDIEQDIYQDEVREDFLDGIRSIAPPAFEIRGSKAICRMGVGAQQAADIWFEFHGKE